MWELRPYLRIISNLAEGGVGGVGETFRAQVWVQKGAGKALGLSRFLQTMGSVKQKSLQRPPTIRFTDFVFSN